MINILPSLEKSRWFAKSPEVTKLIPTVISIWYQNYFFSCHFLVLIHFFPSPFFLLCLLACLFVSHFEDKMVDTDWRQCLNSLIRLAEQDFEHCLAGHECFPIILLLETMEILWLTSCKQYLPQAYGHVLLRILASGAVPVLCKEEHDVVGRGQPCTQVWRWEGDTVEEVSHPELLSGCPALLQFGKDNFLLFPMFSITLSQERKYWL